MGSGMIVASNEKYYFSFPSYDYLRAKTFFIRKYDHRSFADNGTD